MDEEDLRDRPRPSFRCCPMRRQGSELLYEGYERGLAPVDGHDDRDRVFELDRGLVEDRHARQALRVDATGPSRPLPWRRPGGSPYGIRVLGASGYRARMHGSRTTRSSPTLREV